MLDLLDRIGGLNGTRYVFSLKAALLPLPPPPLIVTYKFAWSDAFGLREILGEDGIPSPSDSVVLPPVSAPAPVSYLKPYKVPVPAPEQIVLAGVKVVKNEIPANTRGVLTSDSLEARLKNQPFLLLVMSVK
jgi:hypothetical protein